LCFQVLHCVRHVASSSQNVEHPCHYVYHQQFVLQKSSQVGLEVCNILRLKYCTFQHLICEIFGFIEPDGLPQKIRLLFNLVMSQLWPVYIISSLWKSCLILPLDPFVDLVTCWVIGLNFSP
jgi:hypothetical protein